MTNESSDTSESDTSESDTSGLVVQLFIAGDSEQTRAVCERVREFVTTILRQPYRFDIIDVLEKPDVADGVGMLMTPTLFIHTAHSERRLVGDLSDVTKLELVLSAMGQN